MTADLRDLLDQAGIDHQPGTDAEDVAAILASYDGPNHYQGRASLPGGAVIYAGVHGSSRDNATRDLGALFGTDPKHWTATKLTRPPR